MEITVSHEEGRIPVVVLKVTGQLDGSTYQALITKAREIYAEGARDFLLDLGDLTYISSAGLAALHIIALMVRGEPIPDVENGWASLKSIDKTRGSGVQSHAKLLNPRPEIVSVLEMVGFLEFFQIFSDKQEALNSF